MNRYAHIILRLMAMLVLLTCVTRAYAAEEIVYNLPPSDFRQYPPTSIGGIPGHLIYAFSWEASTDPEGGIILYRLVLTQDGEQIFRKDEIETSFYVVDLSESVPEYDPDKEVDFLIYALDPFWQEVLPTSALPPASPKEVESVEAVTIASYVYGYIYDEETNMPVVSAYIYTPHSSTMSADGTYGMKVQAGTFTLVVSAEGYEQHTQDLTIKEGAVQPINISLKPSLVAYKATLHGAVKDRRTEMPVMGARLRIDDQEFSVEAGTYILSLDAGVYAIVCEADGFESMTANVTLGANEMTLNNILLNATSEHVWAERNFDKDARYLQVSLSGMKDRYDIYVAVMVNNQTIYCLADANQAEWAEADQIVPIASNATILDGTYSLKMMKTLLEPNEDIAVYVICTSPGKSPKQTENWKTFINMKWK